MEPSRASTFFHQGHLAAAIEAGNAAVRAAPADTAARIALAELLVFAGALARADTLLDAAGATDPRAMPAVAQFRQLLRAETARRQINTEGRLPEFLGPPTPALAAALAARVALRAGDAAAASSYAAEQEAQRPRVPGWCNGVEIDDFRDVSDLNAGFFEVLTATGACYWIPTERVASARYAPPTRDRDFYWRQAELSVRDGPEGVVWLPALYDEVPNLTDAQRLGRESDWRSAASGLTYGVGQRMFLAGESAVAAMELLQLDFAP